MPLDIFGGSLDIFGFLNISNDGTKTTILGPSGDYNRIGDAAATDKSLASEDDLMVTGKLEVDGNSYIDGTMYTYGGVVISGGLFRAKNNLQVRFGDSDNYWMYYDSSNTRWAMATTNSDGGGTDADVIRIPDGQVTVDFNATADENVWDEFDDALILRDAYSLGLKEKLIDMGILRKYKDGWIGYTPQRMDALLAGGIYQTRQMLDELKARVEILEAKG